MKRILTAVALAVAATAASAEAQDINQAISAYNEAVSSGDTALRVKTAKALGEAALANPGREDAAILAFEAGQTLCLMADCTGAAELAQFAAGKPLPGNAVQAEDIALLEAYAAWRQKPGGKRRKALNKALEPLVPRDVTTLTLAAFHNRYLRDMVDHDWREAKDSAGEAATHFAPFKDVIGEYWSNAKIATIASGFNYDPDTDHALAMARHHVELGKMGHGLEERPAWLEHNWYVTQAWEMAISAYFHSGGGRKLGSLLNGPDPDRLDRQVDEIMAELDTLEYAPRAEAAASEENADALPYCDGTFDMKPAIRYPHGAARQGMFGAMIAQIAVKDLKVSDVEILAAVPSATFEESAEETIRQWTWKVETGVPGETCTGDRPKIILPIVYALG
ncbi:energy transducer TonB [Henriciella aquimarina]|uniref:energy transducer TonB n=1 Tax=Henriciella aquimarina TaxID=545261 RepID=UPI000A009F0E|nr:energy transducer TonB [Henriciella aquimarina]